MRAFRPWVLNQPGRILTAYAIYTPSDGSSFEKVRSGRGQTVFLVGEAGIGKSRILREFQRRISERATWNEADAMSFGQSMAFHPLIDLLKRRFRIEEGDSEEVMIEKATDHVLQLDADLEPVLPYLRYLLGVDPGDPSVAAMDPQLRLAELFGAVQRLFLRAAQTSPQILLFEDLHWIDKATEEFLVLTADSIPSSRIMCLFTYRPDHVHPFGDRSYHSRIALERLSSEDTLNMAKAMLAAQRLPDELAGLIVGKAEGNPFFVEDWSSEHCGKPKPLPVRPTGTSFQTHRTRSAISTVSGRCSWLASIGWRRVQNARCLAGFRNRA